MLELASSSMGIRTFDKQLKTASCYYESRFDCSVQAQGS
uniref:Uncharacterized protein n=1 Tax=Nelumbo nucifera TaxID=4432 RepID=A0A822YBT5_NELNU|nr:TPA_asm: hypothetical protein HUJ06_010435 [Nelumbo nucifera]